MLQQDRPANCSASCSVYGGTPECAIVTSFKGSKDCTIRSDFPSFLITTNHRERKDEFEGSNTPASIFSFTNRQSSVNRPGGIGIFLWTHGLCGITGISIGGKKSSRKCPRSHDSHAKPSSWTIIK